MPHTGSDGTFGHCLIVGVGGNWHGAHADGVEVKQITAACGIYMQHLNSADASDAQNLTKDLYEIVTTPSM